MTIPIYFEDLCLEKQEEILDELGILDALAMNWDMIPLCTLEIDEEGIE